MKKIIIFFILISEITLSQVITSIKCGSMYYNTHLAIDSTGKIYFSEPLNNRIRKLDFNTCTITNVAGIGTAGYTGNGGMATSAQLDDQWGITFDKQNNLLIADYENHVIRKVNKSTGIITTIAGTGFGAGTPMGGYSGDGGLATLAKLSLPNGVVVDKFGNIFLSEQNNGCIRKVNSSTGIITTIVGTGVPGFSGDGGSAILAQIDPESLALDSLGNIYIGEGNNNRIRKVNVSTGIINTIAGNGIYNYSGDGGQAVNASIKGARGITVDKNGFVYFTDTWNHRIRKIDQTSGIITTIAGTGGIGLSGDRGLAVNATLSYPEGIAIDSIGNIYISDRGNNIIRVIYNCSKHKMTLNFNIIQDLTFTNTWNAYPNYPDIADSARWYWGDGTSNGGFYPTHTYAASGIYTICVTAYSMCGDSVSFCLKDTINNIVKVKNNGNPSNPLLINEGKLISNLNIYPNPTTETLIISDTENKLQNAEIEIINYINQTVFKAHFTNKIDVSKLTNGIYILKITNKEYQNYYSKFIKE